MGFFDWDVRFSCSLNVAIDDYILEYTTTLVIYLDKDMASM